MTAASRRDSLAPSLFPFLAVLLCTMGALVLILMLLVAGAESSGKEAVKQIDEEMQWEQDKLQMVKNGLNEKYEEAKIELEKKRLVLQNYEQHIHELIEELEQLEKTALQAEEKVDTEKDTQKKRDELREALEKQLADAKKEVEKKLKDPKGDKPIFAIIPYDGPNGTHRRPIYLECNGQGVVVQPEGVALSPIDLRPPYGPGNPLDAVLRTIRAEFPATNGAVTSNPYPLLVVRPSGIKHFMMARAAMSGWDDQFGYELVSEELELTFPSSVPKLEEKIVSAIQLARERQAALVMAMPQHYSPNQLDSFGAYGDGTGTSGASGGFGDDSLDFGNGSGGSKGGSSTGGTGSSRRGGFAMGTQQTGVGGTSQSSLAQQGTATGGKETSTRGTNGQLTMSQAASLDPGQTSSRQGLQLQSGGQSTGQGTMSFFGSSGSSDDLLATGSGGDGNQFRSQQNPAGGDLALGGGSSSGDPNNGGLTNNSGVTGASTAQGAYSTGAGGSASGGSSGGPSAGGQAGASGTTGSAGPSMSSISSSGSPSSNGQSSPPSNSGSSFESSADPGQTGGISSLNMNFSKNQGEAAKPIAQTRGRDWAWRDGNRSKTAVIRAIRLQCYSDRWVLLPDRGSNAAPTVISLDGPLIQKAEKLAEVVTTRVNNWGVAVAGGHWAPVVHVDVASDAEFRFQQLQRMMEGSGVDVVRKATIAPQSR